jgi:hypothetical protein
MVSTRSWLSMYTKEFKKSLKPLIHAWHIRQKAAKWGPTKSAVANKIRYHVHIGPHLRGHIFVKQESHKLLCLLFFSSTPMVWTFAEIFFRSTFVFALDLWWSCQKKKKSLVPLHRIFVGSSQRLITVFKIFYFVSPK